MPPSSSLALGHRLLLLLLLATIFQKRLFSKTWTPTLLPTCLLKCAGIFFPILDSLSIHHHSRDSKKSGNEIRFLRVSASSRLLRAKRVILSRQKKSTTRRLYNKFRAFFVAFRFPKSSCTHRRSRRKPLFSERVYFTRILFSHSNTREREEKRDFFFKSPHKKVVRLDPVI